MQRIIKHARDLRRYLSPVDFVAQERIEYSLGSFKSRVAMDLLQVAVRKQATLFGLDDEMVAANVDVDSKTLRVDVRGLNYLNDQIQQRVSNDTVFQIRLLQHFHKCQERMDLVATKFRADAQAGKANADDLIEYFDLVTSYHELGILKFCFPDRLARREIAETMRGDRRLMRDLLRPRGVSLFYELHVQRLRLAWCRLTQSNESYRCEAEKFRQRYGFLGAEDMDFRDHEAPHHLDAEIDRVIELYRSNADAIRSRLQELEEQSAAAQAERDGAWNAFYIWAAQSESRMFRFNLLALSEQLTSHEESNRLCKMRFLRDLSLLLESHGLDRFNATILDAVTSIANAREKSTAQWS